MYNRQSLQYGALTKVTVSIVVVALIITIMHNNFPHLHTQFWLKILQQSFASYWTKKQDNHQEIGIIY